MKFPTLLWLLLTNLVGVSVQQCTREGFEAIAIDQLQSTETSDATFSSVFTINETYYNCLATSETIGEYTSMSVSLLYTISDTPNILRDVRYIMVCIGGAWSRAGINTTALISNVTRTDCYQCTDTASNEDNCSPCDSSCTGLNQCYGPNATQCCNYNDGGNCVADCGMNREGNATFQCVCSNFWTGADCDVCSLNCMNGGTQQSDCSACRCVPGYNGTLCDVNIDECSPNPCQNGGNCTDGINSYTCTCVPGYTGTDCETDIDECSPNPCQNGGNCTDGINSYTCTCVPGYTGTDCETDIDECSPNPCQNGGNCTDGINSYVCTCVPGYTGTDCEIDIDECSPNPCQNGGNCTDGINSYVCTCVPGYTGTDCEIDIDECSPNPCQNGGNCTDGINSYTCTCVPGYTGTDCEIDIDECSPNPCQNGGNCTDGINSYTCTCVPSYTGTDCETDIDKCSPNPCQNGGNCTDGINSYICTCVPGYSGTNCTNIDECSPNPCQNGATCIDGINSYTCTCVPGYTGTDCETNIDECSPNPCQNGNCTDGINSYTCTCVPGYTGTNCETNATNPASSFNDTVIGDPLYEVPLNLLGGKMFPEVTSLCYEIHGRAGQIFNLISDGCVQVNANYSAMDIPANGNIISQIGVLAYDTAGGCIKIIVDVNNCIPVVNGVAYNDTVYDMNGVTARRRNNRARIAVPNCANGHFDNLVFWVVCQNIGGQRMIKFQVLRGSALIPDSHGLIGQFWNIPVTAVGPVVIPSLGATVTYNVTVLKATPRRFVASLFHRTWDRTLKPCLYAGNAQGGPITEVPGVDSVIEGEYFEYAVADGIFGSNFTYNRLQNRTCPV